MKMMLEEFTSHMTPPGNAICLKYHLTLWNKTLEVLHYKNVGLVQLWKSMPTQYSNVRGRFSTSQAISMLFIALTLFV